MENEINNSVPSIIIFVIETGLYMRKLKHFLNHYLVSNGNLNTIGTQMEIGNFCKEY